MGTPSQSPGRDTGQARLAASGALTQQLAQITGLLVLLAIVTALARDLSLAELGTYGLTATLAVYLLVIKNSISSSGLRAMTAATDEREQVASFSTATVLYAGAALATGVLILAAGWGISVLVLEGELAAEARRGTALLAAVTAVGLTATVNLDALRAALRLTRSAANEIAALAVFAALMLGLIAAGAPLWVLIGASGSIPLISGAVNFVSRRALALPFRFERAAVSRAQARLILPTAGWLLVVESSNLVIYGLARIVLGASTSASTVGLYEGPVRAHNVIYALNQAVGLSTLPLAARYAASGDTRRLRELAVRGSRYSLAFVVPLCVTLAVMATPVLELWLGERYGGGATALAILISYWLLWGQLAVTPGFLVGTGHAREVALIVAATAAANLVLTLAITPSLELEGPAIATAATFAAAFPFALRLSLRATGASLGDLARRAWAPAYGLGLVLAAALLILQELAPVESLGALVAVLAAGPLLYWAAFATLALSGEERRLVGQVLRGYRGREG